MNSKTTTRSKRSCFLNREKWLAFAKVLCVLLLSVGSVPALADTQEPGLLTKIKTLQLDFDPDDASGSDFLNHLLLSHGLKLKVKSDQSIGKERYSRFLESIGSVAVTDNPDIEDVSKQFVLAPIVDAASAHDRNDLDGSQALKNRILWWVDNNEASTGEPALSAATSASFDSDATIQIIKSDEPINKTPQPVTQISEMPAQHTLLNTLPEPSSTIDNDAPVAQASKKSTPIQAHELPPPVDGIKAPSVKPSGSTTPPILVVNDNIPEGFEALAGPQYLFVDVYFNNSQVGSTELIMENELITFNDADEVATWLSAHVIDEQLPLWLSEPLPTNGHLACFDNNQPEGCGQVNADPIALIYNAVTLRLDVFIDASRQKAATLNSERYLPTPKTGQSAILSLHGVASDFSTGTSRVDLTGNMILGHKRTHINSSVQYNDVDSRTSLNTLKLTHHWQDYLGEAGTFSFSPGGALNSIDLIGAGFSTSFKTRVDIEETIGSQVVVYLPRRAVVQILIDGRVYSGQSYAAGNQNLDTSALPDGTYEIEILINDSTQTPRSETRLFTKSALIPPSNRWVIAATAGAIRTYDEHSVLPETENDFAASFSASHRMGERAAFRLGVLQHDETSVGLSEFIYLGKRVSFNVALAFGEQRLAAANLQASLRTGQHHWGLSASHFSSRHAVVVSDQPFDNTLFLPDNTRLDLSYSSSTSWLSYGARLGIFQEKDTSDSDDNDNGTQSIFSAYAQRPVFRGRHHRGFLGIRFQKEQDESFAQVSFDLHFGRDAWRASLGADWVNQDRQDSNWQTRAAAAWHSDKLPIGVVSSNVYASSQSDSLRNYGMSAELQHAWFQLKGSTDFTAQQSNSTQRNSIASFTAHAAFDTKGASLGGSDSANAGVIVDVSGEPKGAGFDVLVNNVRASSASIGTSQFISLQAFNNYEIKLRPHSLISNGVGDSTHTLTLFPGNVGRIAVQARKQILLIALVSDTTGKSIQNAAVSTERGHLIIDESGILQAEVHDGEVLIVRLKDQTKCEIVVQFDSDAEEVVTPDEPLICHAI